MTFSRSKRLLKAYEHCRGYYYGFGPTDKKPTRLRIIAWKSPYKRIQILLEAVEVEK